MKFNKLKKNWKFLLVIIILVAFFSIVVYLLLNMNTIFTFNNNYQYNGGNSQVPFNPNEYQSYWLTIRISPTTICVGDSITGSITSNIYNGICSIFLNPGNDWTLFGNINLDSSGSFSTNQRINTVGQATFRAVCCDNNNNCKISNDVSLTINQCGNPDSDGDGWDDQTETDEGTNPNDPNDYPGHHNFETTTTVTSVDCNSFCISNGYISGRFVTSPGYCNSPEISMPYSSGYCCCMPQTQITTTTYQGYYSFQECSEIKQGYFYDRTGDGSDWTQSTCESYARAHCSYASNIGFSHNCCWWNCVQQTTTTTTIPSCYDSCLAITSAEYGSGKFNSQLRIPGDCSASCVSYCSEVQGCVRWTWYQIPGSSEQCCCWQCGIWE